MNQRKTLISLIVLIMLLSVWCFTSVSCRALATDDTGSAVTLEAVASSSSPRDSTSSSTSASYILAKDGRKLLVTIRAHHNVANRKVRTPKNPYDKEGLRFRRRR